MSGDPHDDLAHEQDVVTRLYGLLDRLTAAARQRLERVRRGPTAGTPGALTERDAFDTLYSERITALTAAQERLVFGRMDLVDGTARYVGRIGLADDSQQRVLTDWRSPSAEAFYQATAADPRGVVRRRHLITQGRTVTALEDDVLDLDAYPDGEQVHGGGALMAALASHRTGRMRDIVATIQAEQDAIIRAPLAGTLVVQGAPGCGKTVVALHRAAYLLYAHRDRIEKAGVLVVGPNRQFLRYIEQVLPSLGETATTMLTPGRLFPGVDAVDDTDPVATRLKGDLRMADAVGRAVAQLQRVPDDRVALTVDGVRIHLTPKMVHAARTRARRTGEAHNLARRTFVLDLLDKLAQQLARANHLSDDEEHRSALVDDLRHDSDVRREINLCWLPFTPQQFVHRLLSRDDVLHAAAPWLTKAERAAMRRHDRDEPWRVADVPLLDEAAELLGQDDEAERLAARAASADTAQERAYAQEAARLSGSSGVTADMILARYRGAVRLRSAAEAGEDRSWVYGHVIVDEAQELSPMAWRLLVRRCPSRSMTVAGDIHQTSSAAGAATWAEVFDAVSPDRWTLRELAVNYRTPRPAMHLATRVLLDAGIDVAEPVSARDGAPVVRAGALSPDEVAVRAAAAATDGSRVAVIAPAPRHRALGEALERHCPDAWGGSESAVDHPVALLTSPLSKGLEFDHVIVVAPREITAAPASPRDLYVAYTRTTTTLTIVEPDGD